MGYYSTRKNEIMPFVATQMDLRASQFAPVVNNPPVNAGDVGTVVPSLAQEDTWKRAWQPTPVYLPGESHERRNLEGYHP